MTIFFTVINLDLVATVVLQAGEGDLQDDVLLQRSGQLVRAVTVPIAERETMK